MLLMFAMLLYLALGKHSSFLSHDRVARLVLFVVLVFWVHRLIKA